MREIIKVMLQEGIDEGTIHECLNVINEFNPSDEIRSQIYNRKANKLVSNTAHRRAKIGNLDNLKKEANELNASAERLSNWEEKRLYRSNSTTRALDRMKRASVSNKNYKSEE